MNKVLKTPNESMERNNDVNRKTLEAVEEIKEEKKEEDFLSSEIDSIESEIFK